MSRLSDVFKTVAELRNGDLRAALARSREENRRLVADCEVWRIRAISAERSLREASDERALAAVAIHDSIVEKCAAVIDRLNREGPYQAIIGGREIRKLKKGASGEK